MAARLMRSEISWTASMNALAMAGSWSGCIPWPRFAIHRCVPDLRGVPSTALVSAARTRERARSEGREYVPREHALDLGTQNLGRRVQGARVQVALQRDGVADGGAAGRRVHSPIQPDDVVAAGGQLGQRKVRT